MKNIFQKLFFLGLAVAGWSCDNPATQTGHHAEQVGAALISVKGTDASSPYLTKDQHGNAVLCWTEQLADREVYVLKFAVYDSQSKAFGVPVSVAPSEGTRPHPESMNKVAFKADGTIVAVYAKKHPTAENPFAGSLFYSRSFDKGKHWTPQCYLHSDTLPTYGRSFFDLATLADGEVGTIWLDGRFGEADHGSAVFFARTRKGEGFGKDKQIGESTCECCRTELYADASGRIHVAYRDIIGENIRDMVYQWSADNGKTFSMAQRISPDNWKIDGCPHTGPSLVANKAGLHAVWFTAGGGPGVYHALLRKGQQSFSVREKIGAEARHPQLAVLPGDKLVVAWDESTAPDSKRAKSHGGHSPEESGSKIILQTVGKNTILSTRALSGPGVNASHPVLQALNERAVLVAWVQRNAGKSGVYGKLVDLKDQ